MRQWHGFSSDAELGAHSSQRDPEYSQYARDKIEYSNILIDEFTVELKFRISTCP